MSRSRRYARSFVRGAACVALLLAGEVAALGLPAHPAAAQAVKLPTASGAADDELGHAVAVYGDAALVGAPGTDTQGADSGSASVFVWSGSAWTLQQKLLPSPASANGYFGSAVAIVGDVAAVGAYGDANAGAFAGAVYVFRRTAGVWAISQKLMPADAGATKFFGYSVAMTTDTLVVGASGDATQGSSAGAVYVFSLSGASYAQQQKLLASAGAANDNFGVSVAISGSTLLVGASGDVDNGNGVGSARVFVKGGGGSFTEQQKLVAASGSLNDYFGNTVALSGDTALIGAFADDAKGTDAGAAYLFVRSGATWSQTQKLFAADASAGDYFGFAVGVSGHDAVISAPNDADNGSGSGSAYTFRSNTSWSQRSKLHATDPAASDFFGYAAALGAGNVVVGANGKQDFGSNSGAAYAFSQPVTAVPALGTLAFALMLALLGLTFAALGRARRGTSKIVVASLLLMLGCDEKPSSEQAATVLAGPSAVAATQPLSDTVTLTATRDTAVRASAPDTNSGSSTALDLNRTLVDFDASAMRSAVGAHDYVTSAQLQMRLLSSLLRRTPRTALVYKLTQAWTETGATWDCAIDTNPGNAAADCSGSSQWSMGAAPNPWAVPASAVTAVPASISGAMSADLSEDVRGIVAGESSLGWIIEGSAAGERNDFVSRESATPPQLVLSVRHCDPALCDDGDPCTIDTCDATALCTHGAAIDGTSCNDGDACTQSDSCLAGVCTGANPVTCAAADQCHLAGTCDSATGTCSDPAAANGSPCQTGAACTIGETCNQGVCQGGSPDPSCGSLTDDFEGGLLWSVFEEQVAPNQSCYGVGIASVVTAPVSQQTTLATGLGLDVVANAAHSAQSNHVIAQRRLDTTGRGGAWAYSTSFYIDPSGDGQTGPEISMQNTRNLDIGWATATAGIQYRSNPWAPNYASWAVWAETGPRTASWVQFASLELTRGKWYRLMLVADYDQNQYERLALYDDAGLVQLWDLSQHRIALEQKFTEAAFWVTLEAENLWNNCGTAGNFTNRVQYDHVRLER